MRALTAAVTLALAFTLVPYVRRAPLPRRAAAVTDVDGSRDRSLPGKARLRARRGR